MKQASSPTNPSLWLVQPFLFGVLLEPIQRAAMPVPILRVQTFPPFSPFSVPTCPPKGHS